jgi:hypothetical protein
MFCVPVLVFGGSDGVESCFLFLRSRTHFRRFRGRRDPFSCFVSLYSFSAEARVSCPVFMFCVPGYVFDGMEGVGSRFQVLRSRTHFRWFRGRQILFSYHASSYSFSAVVRASCPDFIFCVPVLIFGGSEGVGSRFHALRSRTHFRQYRGRMMPFSCFALPDSFSVVPWASAPVFMFCAHGLIFGYSEGVGSHFVALRSRTRFRRYCGRRLLFSSFALPDSFLAVLRHRSRFRRFRGRRVPFSCFAFSYSFSTVARASSPVFKFCAPGPF